MILRVLVALAFLTGITRGQSGWQRLSIEAGGTAWDIDGDGDLDVVFGGDASSNEIWWWENPSPNFHPDIPWTRRVIKNSDGAKHHNQLAADFDGDGQVELITWNQRSFKLLLYRAPASPKESGPWTPVPIFTWKEGEMEGLAICDVNGDGKTDLVGGGRWFEHVSGDTFREHPQAVSLRRRTTGLTLLDAASRANPTRNEARGTVTCPIRNGPISATPR